MHDKEKQLKQALDTVACNFFVGDKIYFEHDFILTLIQPVNLHWLSILTHEMQECLSRGSNET